MAQRILFLVPYPLHESPSQRFRFEQYFDLLKGQEYSYTIQSFLNIHNWKVFYSKGKLAAKCRALVSGFAKRVIAVAKSPMYDFVFIHREVAPVGPPVFEWILAKVFRKKVIYDFDDAIWLTDREHEPRFLRAVKWRRKVSSICRWAYRVSCGNEHLCAYAAQFNKNVVYNPTTIDTENLHNRLLYKDSSNSPTNKIRIGWTGSHSTLKYLQGIEFVLENILLDYPEVEFVVIADEQPVLDYASTVKFVRWNRASEIKDLLQFDIGVMPLPDDQWSRGKCGFKALQYMALEFPAVATPVGVNHKIINHGINGFLCNTPDEWNYSLRMLIDNPNLRKELGARGRKTVVENYSVISNSDNFLSLFEE